MYNILALAIGALISIMLSVNGRLEGVVGLTNSLIIIHVVGLLTITFIMLIKRERIKIDKKIPIYMFLGGAIGVALTLVNMITISKRSCINNIYSSICAINILIICRSLWIIWNE